VRVRPLAPSIAVIALAFSCASRGPLPPGDDLEDPDGARRTVRDSRGNARIPTDRQPSLDELDQAFDEPGVPAPRKAGLTGGSAVEPAPLEDDPMAAQQAAFETEAPRVQAQVTARSPEAPAAAAALSAGAEALGPSFQERALRLQVGAARAVKDDAAAHALTWKWLLVCGPTEPDRCRRDALAEAGRTAKAAPAPAAAAARITEVKTHDACLRAAEAAARRKDAPLPGCLDAALAHYRSQGDRLMLARLQLARAESKNRAGAPEARRELERASGACGEPRCLEVRRRALQRLAGAHLLAGDVEAAARVALSEMHLHAQALPPARRPWAWSEDAEKACRALDGHSGEGSCRKLEGRLFARHLYRDFSAAPAKGEGLTPDQVRAVNAHYGVSLEPCLAEEAARLRPPAQERYTVRWTVGNDGRVTQFQMDRNELHRAPLAVCLRQKLGLWRYPRFHGELQHVEQTFGVSAAVRR
jgi:hypothetical protein